MLSPSLVILSAAENFFQLALRVNSAKHLQYLVGDKQMQILRCAQNDMAGGSFTSQPYLRIRPGRNGPYR